MWLLYRNCPTFVLLGDELDSPRGRIYLIKDMLEDDRPASDRVVTRRSLSIVPVLRTCPSGVNHMHLVDHARNHIERTYNRPAFDRAARAMLAAAMPYPGGSVSRCDLRNWEELSPGQCRAD